MIPWIQVYSNLLTHRKTGRLADELGLSNKFVSPCVIAVGMLISLWTWAIQNATDGDLGDCSPQTIADACRWKGKAQTLVNALTASGYLDPDGRLHDWEEYALLLIEKEDSRKASGRERSREYRERKKKKTRDASHDASHDDGVTVTETSQPPFIPPLSSPQTPYLSPPYNPPIPDHTEPNQTNSFCSEKERKKKDPAEATQDEQHWLNKIEILKRYGCPADNGLARSLVEQAAAAGFAVDFEAGTVRRADNG